MNKVADPTLYWAVLARPRGEVLTAEAESPGLHLGLLGVPPGLGASESEAWLYEVMGVAHESSAAPSASLALPALLHQALTGLLFSHGELWDRQDAPRPCSFAFAHTVHEVGFGWVGDAEITLWVDGQIHEPEWVVVQDPAGREARAWSISSDHSVQVRLVWSASPATGAEVEAVWSAAPGEEASEHAEYAAPIAEPASATEYDAAPQVDPYPVGLQESRADHGTGAEAEMGEMEPALLADDQAGAEVPVAMPRARGSAVSRWLRRGFSWMSGMGRRERETAEPVLQNESAGESAAWQVADAGPGAVEEPVLGAHDAGGWVAGEPIAAEPEPISPTPASDLIPPTPEPESITRSAAPTTPEVPAAPVAPRVWRAMPPQIPSTPEPAELTERAALWAEPPDPHIIELPPPRTSRAVLAASVAAEPPVIVPPALAPPVAPPPVAPPPMLQPSTPTRVPPVAPPAAVSAPLEPVPVVAPIRNRVPAKPPQRPAWPTAQQLARRETPLWRRPWVWAVAVLVLFAGGWLVGAGQEERKTRDAAAGGALGGALRAIGLGGPRYVVNVTSHPPGAWIAVDGKTLALRTPASVEVTPGEHAIGLSFSDLGGATYTVRGLKGDRVPLDATLWGALEIFSPNEVGIIGVAIDGEMRGYAPLSVDSLTPGVHEVRFSGPGVTPWGQTVDIRVGETKEMLARATPSPSTGVLQVQATITDGNGTQPLKGGQVWIDGQLRGNAPLTLDLARGPHSVRLVHKGQEAPIQVIDLPGGNQRFTVFEFGTNLDGPSLIADLPPRVPRDRPTTVTATLAGVRADEVREMWLHVQTADGPWRRHSMTLLKAAANVVGVAVFPATSFDAQGRARYYVSAQSRQGEEAFTEIRTVQLEKPAAP